MIQESQISKRILPFIVLSQFLCTSLWFSGNAIINDLIREFNLSSVALSQLTSSVQLGFIVGTLLFAVFTITDKFSPVAVFLFCAILGAISNLGMVMSNHNLTTLSALRFATGITLAGIYPVGMKVTADFYTEGLGKSLGYLVGALVLGTALPHGLNGIGTTLDWKQLIIATSILAIIGGLIMRFGVGNGPNRRASQKVDLFAFFKVFQNDKFRSAAFGYFGHMWELYTFWAFVPLMIMAFNNSMSSQPINVSLYSFLIIGIGSIGCMLSGIWSMKYGSKKVATYALTISGLCCLVSPILFYQSSLIIFILILLIWGFSVVADSPLFSTLVAQNAPLESKGTALTIVNCIGFSLTIFSIQFVNWIQSYIHPEYIYVALAIGPILGLIGFLKTKD